MINGDFSDAQALELVEELGVRLHDEIATFLIDHPEVPPALVGLRVGQVFLIHFQLRYGSDFAKAARDTFDLILRDAEKPPIAIRESGCRKTEGIYPPPG